MEDAWLGRRCRCNFNNLVEARRWHITTSRCGSTKVDHLPELFYQAGYFYGKQKERSRKEHDSSAAAKLRLRSLCTS